MPLRCLIPARLRSCRVATEFLSLKRSKQVKQWVKSAENSCDTLKRFIMRWAANNNNKKCAPVWKTKEYSTENLSFEHLILTPCRWIHSKYNGFKWRSSFMVSTCQNIETLTLQISFVKCVLEEKNYQQPLPQSFILSKSFKFPVQNHK